MGEVGEKWKLVEFAFSAVHSNEPTDGRFSANQHTQIQDGDVVFRGRFEVRLDDKNRFRLPGVWKTQLPKAETFVLTNGLFRGVRCLDLYTQAGWEGLEKRISRLSPLKAEVQSFQRFYLSAGQNLELDSASRLLIPNSLREYASLSEDVILVGMAEKVEIWSKAAWTQLHESLADSFEQTLASLAQLDSEEK